MLDWVEGMGKGVGGVMTPLVSVGWNFYDNFPSDYRVLIHEFVKSEVAEAVVDARASERARISIQVADALPGEVGLAVAAAIGNGELQGTRFPDYVAVEREACAKVADQMAYNFENQHQPVAREISAAIRGRG